MTKEYTEFFFKYRVKAVNPKELEEEQFISSYSQGYHFLSVMAPFLLVVSVFSLNLKNFLNERNISDINQGKTFFPKTLKQWNGFASLNSQGSVEKDSFSSRGSSVEHSGEGALRSGAVTNQGSGSSPNPTESSTPSFNPEWSFPRNPLGGKPKSDIIKPPSPPIPRWPYGVGPHQSESDTTSQNSFEKIDTDFVLLPLQFDWNQMVNQPAVNPEKSLDEKNFSLIIKERLRPKKFVLFEFSFEKLQEFLFRKKILSQEQINKELQEKEYQKRSEELSEKEKKRGIEQTGSKPTSILDKSNAPSIKNALLKMFAFLFGGNQAASGNRPPGLGPGRETSQTGSSQVPGRPGRKTRVKGPQSTPVTQSFPGGFTLQAVFEKRDVSIKTARGREMQTTPETYEDLMEQWDQETQTKKAFLKIKYKEEPVDNAETDLADASGSSSTSPFYLEQNLISQVQLSAPNEKTIDDLLPYVNNLYQVLSSYLFSAINPKLRDNLGPEKAINVDEFNSYISDNFGPRFMQSSVVETGFAEFMKLQNLSVLKLDLIKLALLYNYLNKIYTSSKKELCHVNHKLAASTIETIFKTVKKKTYLLDSAIEEILKLAKESDLDEARIDLGWDFAEQSDSSNILWENPSHGRFNLETLRNRMRKYKRNNESYVKIANQLLKFKDSRSLILDFEASIYIRKRSETDGTVTITIYFPSIERAHIYGASRSITVKVAGIQGTNLGLNLVDLRLHNHLIASILEYFYYAKKTERLTGMVRDAMVVKRDNAKLAYSTILHRLFNDISRYFINTRDFNSKISISVSCDPFSFNFPKKQDETGRGREKEE